MGDLNNVEYELRKIRQALESIAGSLARISNK